MSARWTPEDRERKKRAIRGLLRSWLATIRLNHPATGKACTTGEALEALRGMQEHVITRYAQEKGFAVAQQYRQLIREVLAELAATAADD